MNITRLRYWPPGKLIRVGLRSTGAGLVRLSYWPQNGPPPRPLEGDRDVEYSWVVSRMGRGPGRALDFGCGTGYLGLVAARRGYQVTAIDLMPVSWLYRMAGLKFVQGDLLTMDLPPRGFNLIINCSTVEHVGLAGRYGSPDLPDGDREAMRKLHDLAKPAGKMLLTIPVGRDAVFAPLHRVYGEERLPRLLEGWAIEKQEFWVRQADGRWAQVERSDALALQPQATLYGLGLFVLKPQSE